MASVVTYDDGLRRIDFSFSAQDKRRSLRLGRVSQAVAKTYQARVKEIIADKTMNRPHDPELAKWLGGLDETMLARFRAAGLADGGVGTARTTLGDFLARAMRDVVGKPSTRIFYEQVAGRLIGFFGETRVLRAIGHADADAFRAWLIADQKLAPATVGRGVSAARTFWRKAVRWKLASENVFEGVKGGHQANDARKQFVPADLIQRVMAETPDREWRVIIALARFAGLRTPSETLALRWGDIDWERGTIRVSCPKLEHFEHLAQRTVPLFAELRTPLLDLFHEEAATGAEHVIVRNRINSTNLRQGFMRILRRAGIAPWPRLFQNLRASRESELMRQYDLATVCKWIGNSPTIAARHYAVSVDLNADFQRAAGLDSSAQAQQKAQQSVRGNERPSVTGSPEKPQNCSENDDLVTPVPAVETAGTGAGWAIQDLNL